MFWSCHLPPLYPLVSFLKLALSWKLDGYNAEARRICSSTSSRWAPPGRPPCTWTTSTPSRPPSASWGEGRFEGWVDGVSGGFFVGFHGDLVRFHVIYIELWWFMVTWWWRNLVILRDSMGNLNGGLPSERQGVVVQTRHCQRGCGGSLLWDQQLNQRWFKGDFMVNGTSISMGIPWNPMEFLEP